MSRSRLEVLVPWVVLACLVRVWLAPGERALLATVPEDGATAAACAAHGCGCPHERAATECCCIEIETPMVVARTERRPARARARTAPNPAVVATTDVTPFPASVLDSFECAGGQGDQAAPGPRRAPVGPVSVPPELPGFADGGWLPVEGCRPPRDPRCGPEAPPPRAA